MNKQKRLGVFVIVALALLVLSAGVVSAVELTQNGPPWLAESEDNGEYWGPMHGRRGRWSSEEPFPHMHDLMVKTVAEVTGLTTGEIDARLKEGERLISIALDSGLTEDAFFDLVAETRAEFLAEAVEAGWITQEQYQWMLERKQNATFERGFGGCHRFDAEGERTGGRGPGRGHGRRW